MSGKSKKVEAARRVYFPLPDLSRKIERDSARRVAVTKSGTGTWDLGRGDSGTWGPGDVGTRGRGDLGTWGLGDSGTRGRGDSGTRGLGDSGTRGRGDVGTWGRGDVETRGLGDSGTCELGDVGTHFYHLFNFSSYFTKSLSVDRN